MFHYEVMKNHQKACELADSALQNALEKIDDLEEEDFRDAKSIIELLKENLTLWKEEGEEGNNIDDLWIRKNVLNIFFVDKMIRIILYLFLANSTKFLTQPPSNNSRSKLSHFTPISLRIHVQ